MEFELKAKLTVDNGNESIEENTYRLVYAVNLLETDNRNAVFYDKELKMHFERESAVRYIYETETKEVEVFLSRPLAKSEDFTRRLFYRYDWLKLGVEASGKISDVENREELRQNWTELKDRISKDYRGGSVDNWLKYIGEVFNKKEGLYSALFQYLHFGLLFPGIPLQHGNEWQVTRPSGFSEYEREMFDSTLIYTGKEGDLRTYRISGTTREGSRTRLTVYEGKIRVPEDDLLPQTADVEVGFAWGQLNIGWHFALRRKD